MRNGPSPPPPRLRAILAAAVVVAAGLLGNGSAQAEVTASRRTSIVRAVERAQGAVVSIHGEKTVHGEADPFGSRDERRRVNGMGTGVVVDQRGYIITNQHVIDGVRKIHVTLADGKSFLAEPVSRDFQTDLAIIRIRGAGDLAVIDIGTSSDLMPGETVLAVGNAYGYQHTVTRGVVSALHRTVQISDTQTYEELIQTDASINPGNSGGPLLNIDGQMVGINVAVRTGAQGIGFAIPVDKVVAVATDLLSVRRLDKTWHGVVAKSDHSSRLTVARVEKGSPAAAAGIKPGDEIIRIESRPIARALDLERALLGHDSGDEIEIVAKRSGQTLALTMELKSLPTAQRSVSNRAWDALGLRLAPLGPKGRQRRLGRYRGGLAVTAVRAGGPADAEGIRSGDVLVGMHVWETVTMDNVSYILNRPDLAKFQPLKFYVLRGDQTYFGHLSVAHHQSSRDDHQE